MFDLARVSIAAGATQQDDVSLNSSGRFLGCSVCIDANLAVTVAPDVEITVGKTDNSELVLGDAISQVRVRRANNDAAAAVFGAHLVVYIGY